jgi:hypothetical protein
MWQPLLAQQPQAAPAGIPRVLMGEEVVSRLVQRNLERAKALSTFQGTRVYRLDYQGFPGSRSAEMVVDVTFNSPATVQFTIRSSTGSRLLLDKVLKKLLQAEKESLQPKNQSHVALNTENYIFTLAGQENKPAGRFYILRVEPRTKNKMLYRGRIWVDAEDFAVARIEAGPAESPSLWIKGTEIEQIYRKVAEFWLPASNRSISTSRVGGTALLTIEYKDYQVTAISTQASPTGPIVPTRDSDFTQFAGLGKPSL